MTRIARRTIRHITTRVRRHLNTKLSVNTPLKTGTRYVEAGERTHGRLGTWL